MIDFMHGTDFYKLKSGGKKPAKRRKHNSYPFRHMNVNDYFDAPLHDWDRVRKAAWATKKAHGLEFTTRKIQENGQHIIRVWRVK